MNSKKIIEKVGGRKAVMAMTGLTRGRVSQFVTENHIPKHWILLFKEKFPNLKWEKLLNESKYDKKLKFEQKASFQ